MQLFCHQREKKSRSTRALRLFCAGDVILLRVQHPPFMGGGCEISVRSATRRKVYRPTAELLSVPIQYLRGDASWPTMAHNTLVEEKSPRCLPAYTRARMCVCVLVCVRAPFLKRGWMCPSHTRVHACAYVCAYYPRAISYRSPTDNSYLGEAVFLPTSSGGGMRSSQGRAYCVSLWKFRLNLFFTYTLL